jgi:AcrR family transcriptional regulator
VEAGERSRQILAAAARVFARQGYQAARIDDIAKEAGVAHGLLYHYFDSKQAVLDAVFRDAWGRLLAAIESAEVSGHDGAEQLALVVKIVLRAWRDDPDLVRVLVREVTHGPHLQDELAEITAMFSTLERIVERGRHDGSVRATADPKLAAWMLYGALDEILTGWVLGRLPDDAAGVAAAETEVIGTLVGGLRA